MEMNQRQKSAIRLHQRALANGLILDEDFYAALREKKLFTDTMIGTIKAEPTDKDKVYKMLKMLPKRGPDAFDKFVKILNENFHWLAEGLEERYAQILHDDAAANAEQEQTAMKTVKRSLHGRMSSFEDASRSAKPQQKNVSTTPQYRESTFFSQDFNFQHAREYMENEADQFNKQETCKGYADACISPIHVLESPRKTTSFIQSPQKRNNKKETNTSFTFQRPYQININTSESESSDNEDAVDGCPNECISIKVEDDENGATASHDSTESTYSNADESEHEEESDESKDNNDSEVNQILQDKDLVSHSSISEQRARKISPRCHHSVSIETVTNDNHKTHLKDMYSKLKHLVDKGKVNPSCHLISQSRRDGHVMDDAEMSIELINDLIDELTDISLKNENANTVEKCYELIGSKDRKIHLNVYIERLQEEIKELGIKLEEEKKKSDKMAYDMYTNSQEMQKLTKLRDSQLSLQDENNNLKQKCKELQDIKDHDMKTITDLNKKVELLQQAITHEKQLNMREDRKFPAKRLVTNPRKNQRTGMLRKPGCYPSSLRQPEPRKQFPK